jgi:hypothetical protein
MTSTTTATTVKFSKANAKIEALRNDPELARWLTEGRKVYSFDLLSGHSCPFARVCLSKATVVGGKRKIKDGPQTEFRCFSASQEVQYTNVYNSRKANFDALRGLDLDDMIAELNQALPANAGIVRIHVAGDFFNRDYALAWWNVAVLNPTTLFYFYTKSLRYWLDISSQYGMPENLIMTASRGGRDDHLIDEHGLKEAVVVYTEKQAEDLGLEIDHDDSHAANPSLRDESFALLIHGTQPKGSEASEALKVLKREGTKHSYSRKK